jgi:fatty-acid desaturase
MEPSLHESLALLAEIEGVSLNQFMVNRLAQAAGEKPYEENDKAKNRTPQTKDKEWSGFLVLMGQPNHK